VATTIGLQKFLINQERFIEGSMNTMLVAEVLHEYLGS
jgi:hypothetical protein